jgi:hypothetical protein
LVGKARGVVRCPALSRPPPASRPEPLANGKTAPAGTSQRHPYHSRTMSRCAPENCRQTFPKKFGGFHPASTRVCISHLIAVARIAAAIVRCRFGKCVQTAMDDGNE